jgi:hypothetical protein
MVSLQLRLDERLATLPFLFFFFCDSFFFCVAFLLACLLRFCATKKSRLKKIRKKLTVFFHHSFLS